MKASIWQLHFKKKHWLQKWSSSLEGKYEKDKRQRIDTRLPLSIFSPFGPLMGVVDRFQSLVSHCS